MVINCSLLRKRGWLVRERSAGLFSAPPCEDLHVSGRKDREEKGTRATPAPASHTPTPSHPPASWPILHTERSGGQGSSRRSPCPSTWVEGPLQVTGHCTATHPCGSPIGRASQQLCPDQVETHLFLPWKIPETELAEGAVGNTPEITSKCEGTRWKLQWGDGGRTLRCLWGRDRDWLLGSWAFLFPFLGKPFFPRKPLLLQLPG